MEIYKYIIDKGGYFGIVCVFILIFVSIFLRAINKRKENSEKLLVQLLKFIQIFCIISTIAIFSIRVYDRYLDNTSHEVQNYVQRTPQIVNLSQIPHTLILSERYKIQFNKNATFCFIKTEKSYWTNETKIDTVFYSEISKIKEFKTYAIENIFVIYYNDGTINSEFGTDHNFNLPNLQQYVYNLRSIGYNIKVDSNIMSWITISIMIVLFLAFPLGIAANQSNIFGGCFVVIVIFIIIFFLVFSLRGCTGYFYG